MCFLRGCDGHIEVNSRRTVLWFLSRRAEFSISINFRTQKLSILIERILLGCHLFCVVRSTIRVDLNIVLENSLSSLTFVMVVCICLVVKQITRWALILFGNGITILTCRNWQTVSLLNFRWLWRFVKLWFEKGREHFNWSFEES